MDRENMKGFIKMENPTVFWYIGIKIEIKWVIKINEYLNRSDAPKYLSGKKGNADDTT